MDAPRPITIEDRVQRSDVAVIVRIETEQVDEFAQEIEGIVNTLHGEVRHIRATPAQKGDRR